MPTPTPTSDADAGLIDRLENDLPDYTRHDKPLSAPELRGRNS